MSHAVKIVFFLMTSAPYFLLRAFILGKLLMIFKIYATLNFKGNLQKSNFACKSNYWSCMNMAMYESCRKCSLVFFVPQHCNVWQEPAYKNQHFSKVSFRDAHHVFGFH